jgi:hypothetical protein
VYAKINILMFFLIHFCLNRKISKKKKIDRENKNKINNKYK